MASSLDFIKSLPKGFNTLIGKQGINLSGGQKQRLSIIRAILKNTPILVLDEATEGLAPIIRREIWSVVQQVKKTGISTIVVDKDVDSLLEVSDKSLILVKGEVVFSGASSKLSDNPDIPAQHLGV